MGGELRGDVCDGGRNSVLQPLAVVGRCINIYPTSCVRGVIPANSIYKDKVDIVLKQ